MAALKFKVIVTDPPIILERRIRTVIADKINKSAKDTILSIRPQLGPLLYNSIMNSPEAKSLFGGILQAELGPKDTDVNAVLNFVVQRLVDTISIDFKPFSPFGGIMRGHIELSLYPKTLTNDILAFSASSYLTGKGVKIPWMEWLLTLGDRVIVRRYTVDYLHTRNSRTGLATMAPDKTKGWRVPPAFSGTTTNNFISRALDDLSIILNVVFEKEFLKHI